MYLGVIANKNVRKLANKTSTWDGTEHWNQYINCIVVVTCIKSYSEWYYWKNFTQQHPVMSSPHRLQFQPGEKRKAGSPCNVERRRLTVTGESQTCVASQADRLQIQIQRQWRWKRGYILYKKNQKNLKITPYWKQSNWQECSPGHSTKPSPGTYAPRVTNPHAPSNPHYALSRHSKLLL